MVNDLVDAVEFDHMSSCDREAIVDVGEEVENEVEDDDGGGDDGRKVGE